MDGHVLTHGPARALLTGPISSRSQMFLPRSSFFPLHLDDAFRARFNDYIPKGEADEMWLEADGRPLKWFVRGRRDGGGGGGHGARTVSVATRKLILRRGAPRGGGGGGGGGGGLGRRRRQWPIGMQFDLLSPQDVLPWSIHVRFRQFPSTLVHYGGLEALQLHFYSMLKQAEYVRTGAARKIMNISKVDQTQLWDGCRMRT